MKVNPATMKSGETRANVLCKKFWPSMRALGPSACGAKPPDLILAETFAARVNSIVCEALVVRENRSAVRIRVFVNRSRINPQAIDAPRSWPEIAILHFLHGVARLPECGQSVRAIHGPFSSIVRRHRHIQIAIVSLQPPLQISNRPVPTPSPAQAILHTQP